MQVSTKGRYALRFLLDLARHASDGDIPLKDVAARQDISKKYLERIAALLAPSGMMRVTRGAYGGYRLAKDPADITVADVLRVTEGSLAPIPCLDNDPQGCERRVGCTTLKMWQGLDQAVEAYLSGITLQDMIDDFAPAPEYFI
jgi:Rrf2 family protein